MIAESIGEPGQSRAAVIEALFEHSPGAVSQEQKDDIEKRVISEMTTDWYFKRKRATGAPPDISARTISR